MISFRTQVILTNIALFAFVVLAHGVYVGGIALILGADLPSSIALGLIGGVVIRNFIERVTEKDRNRAADRAKANHRQRMAENPRGILRIRER